jgi:hypothetical protein
MRLDYYALERGDPEKFPLQSPNLFDHYLDARPNDRIRAFVRGRLLYNPTVNPDGAAVLQLGGGGEELDVALDQLWLKFDIARVVYVTLGQQPLRWGTGRFWNPTDFLSSSFKDPLAVYDDRLGVAAIKLHFPVESLGWNFYLLADMGGSFSPERVGGSFRAEFLFDQTELTTTVAVRKDEPLRLGMSVSTGVWWFDLKAEFAALHGVKTPYWEGGLDLAKLEFPSERDREDEWIPQAIAGFELGIPYANDDSLYLGGEYFYNHFGYDDATLYPWLLFQGSYVPFYTGRHYAAFYLALPSPLEWNDTTWTASAIGNLSDLSFVTRLDFRVRILTYLDFNAYAQVHFGDNGEFHFSADIPPVPGVEGLEDGIEIAAPLLDVGMGLSVYF